MNTITVKFLEAQVLRLNRATDTLNANLNSRERKAQRLLAHYATCERLARYMMGRFSIQIADPERKPLREIDGKRISVALWKAEQAAQKHAERLCGDRLYTGIDQARDRVQILNLVEQALGTLPPGFFVNSDPRGYALKIDNENPEGAALIREVGLQTDVGGFGLLSPTINGDR